MALPKLYYFKNRRGDAEAIRLMFKEARIVSVKREPNRGRKSAFAFLLFSLSFLCVYVCVYVCVCVALVEAAGRSARVWPSLCWLCSSTPPACHRGSACGVLIRRFSFCVHNTQTQAL